MKTKLLLICIVILGWSCSNSVNYSETFKADTSGNYLYNLDDVITVYYEDNTLFLNWRGGKIKPVALEENVFFVAEMYKKFKFVQHPETKERYMSVLPEEGTAKLTYDYIKVPKGYKTPSAHLEDGEYDKALEGYLKIKQQDSTSVFIEEWGFNSMSYKHLRKKEYDQAIGILEMNSKLHPNSANVYDSLAEAYLQRGDSLQAYNNYKKTLSINRENRNAQTYVSENASKFENLE